MTDDGIFRLRKQEDLVASMVNYMASHTTRINDFNQGSIVRSLIEAVSQEIFRQNVSFAQGITDSVRTSIKQAFGLPLLDAVRAYGQFTFYRKMLDAPSSVAVTYATVTDNRLVRATFSDKTSSGSSGLSAGTYYYSIAPVFSTGEQLGSNPVSGEMILTSPQTITLTWVAVTGATGYKIYRADNVYMMNAVTVVPSIGSGATVTITDSGSNFTTYRIWPGTSYTWGVTARNLTNNASAETLGGYVRSAPTLNTAYITWSPSVAGDTASRPLAYKIYRSVINYALAIPSGATVVQSSNSATSGLTIDTTYYYSISCLTNSGESLGSVPVSVKAAATLRSATIGWDSMTNNVGFRIYRATNSAMNATLVYKDIIDPTTVSFVDTNLTIVNVANRWTESFYLGEVSSQTQVGTQFVWRAIDSGIGGVSSDITGTGGTIGALPRLATAFGVQGDISIGAGTRVGVFGTSRTYEIPYQQVLPEAANETTTTIISTSYGTVGNTPANTIQNLLTTIYGIASGNNAQSIVNGAEIETEEEWRIRFGKIIRDLARGTAYSIGAGAQTVRLYDGNGFIVEQVTKALPIETSAQVVTLYIHNGTSAGSSQSLIDKTQNTIDGYVDEQGNKYPGYKPAGIPVTVAGATTQSQDVYVYAATLSGYSLLIVRTSIKYAITNYFDSLDISDGFQVPVIQSVSAIAPTGNIYYQYQIVATDSNGNKSTPSAPYSITNGAAIPNNTISWTRNTTGPTIVSYDVLRWDEAASSWGYVTTVNYSSSNAMSYTDTSTSTLYYTFTSPIVKAFNKSSLIQAIMATPGMASVKINVFDSNSADQEIIVPITGKILVCGSIILR